MVCSCQDLVESAKHLVLPSVLFEFESIAIIMIIIWFFGQMSTLFKRYIFGHLNCISWIFVKLSTLQGVSISILVCSWSITLFLLCNSKIILLMWKVCTSLTLLILYRKRENSCRAKQDKITRDVSIIPLISSALDWHILVNPDFEVFLLVDSYYP